MINGVFANANYGAYTDNDTSFDGTSFENCNYGAYINGSNNKYKDCSFTGSSVSGIRFATPSIGYSALIDGCTFTSCGAGIYFYYFRGGLVRNCEFLSNTIDIDMNDYSSDIWSVGNSHTSPVSWAYSTIRTTGVMHISECTIDAPSIAKAFKVVSGDQYHLPQYTIQNSFGGISGTYWPNAQLVSDYTVYRTAGPSLKFSFNTTVEYNWFDVKMVSCYAKSGQSKKFSIYMKRDGSVWAGSLIPHFKLNGKTLTTESEITSLTTSWVLYEYTCPGASITSDGELSLEFEINANTVPIWIDDFTVTDV